MEGICQSSLAEWLEVVGALGGFASSLAMGWPAIRSIDSRLTLTQAARTKLDLHKPERLEAAERRLLDEAESQIRGERRMLLFGAILLATAFLAFVASALLKVYCAL